jgi:hypothetical protein
VSARSHDCHGALVRKLRDDRSHGFVAADHSCYRERQIVSPRQRDHRAQRRRRWLLRPDGGDEIVAPSGNGDDEAARSSPLTAHPLTATAKNAPASTPPSRESGFVLCAFCDVQLRDQEGRRRVVLGHSRLLGVLSPRLQSSHLPPEPRHRRRPYFNAAAGGVTGGRVGSFG